MKTTAAGLSLSLIVACAPAAPPALRVVDIVSADGVALKGTLFAAPAAGPAVLLLHQCDDQRSVWQPLGTRLAAAASPRCLSTIAAMARVAERRTTSCRTRSRRR